jgi:hypothetical protein
MGIRFECPRQRIDRQWNIVLRFCDFSNIGILLASEFDFLNNRVSWEEFADDCWDTEFGQASSDYFQWQRWCHTHFLRQSSQSISTLRFRAGSIMSFDLIT